MSEHGPPSPQPTLEASPFRENEHPQIYAAKAYDFMRLLAEGLPQIRAMKEAGLPSPTKPHARFLLQIPELRLLYEAHLVEYEALEAKLTATSMRVRLEALDELALRKEQTEISLKINQELAKLFNLYPTPTPAQFQPLPVNITIQGVPAFPPQTIQPTDDPKTLEKRVLN
jgi:hypothetical protein